MSDCSYRSGCQFYEIGKCDEAFYRNYCKKFDFPTRLEVPKGFIVHNPRPGKISDLEDDAPLGVGSAL